MPSKTDIGKEIGARLFWWKAGVNIYQKLYGTYRAREFWRDSKALCAAIYQFRSRCVGRGWNISESDQEKLIAKLVSRCKDAIDKNAMEHSYVPGYLGKALSRFVDEIADEAHRKWKAVPSGQMPADAVKALVEATLSRSVTEKLEAI